MRFFEKPTIIIFILSIIFTFIYIILSIFSYIKLQIVLSPQGDFSVLLIIIVMSIIIACATPFQTFVFSQYFYHSANIIGYQVSDISGEQRSNEIKNKLIIWMFFGYGFLILFFKLPRTIYILFYLIPYLQNSIDALTMLKMPELKFLNCFDVFELGAYVLWCSFVSKRVIEIRWFHFLYKL